MLLVQAALTITTVLLWTSMVAVLSTAASGLVLVYGLLTVAFSLASAVTTYLGRSLVAVTVRGVSMEPTYHDGDRVLVQRNRSLAPGQVVVVESPTRGAEWLGSPIPGRAGAVVISDRHWMIKRVVAVPGDPVPSDQAPALAHVPDTHVPPGKLVVVGDNREKSFDSRQIGYVPVERVLGVVLRPLSTSER
ncbi:S26 family signal peptidase [Sphaerisporangium sp. NPDC004334]